MDYSSTCSTAFLYLLILLSLFSLRVPLVQYVFVLYYQTALDLVYSFILERFLPTLNHCFSGHENPLN